MQHTIPDNTAKNEIIKSLDDTRANRQQEIRCSKKTITDILLKYPRLKDYKGEMVSKNFNAISLSVKIETDRVSNFKFLFGCFQIDKEYRAVYPHHDKFLSKFTTQYVYRILKYLESHRPDLLDTAADLEGYYLNILNKILLLICLFSVLSYIQYILVSLKQ